MDILSNFCQALRHGGVLRHGGHLRRSRSGDHRGRAVQVGPIKPTLQAPGAKHLKLTYDKMLSSFAFNFNLRRYTAGTTAAAMTNVITAIDQEVATFTTATPVTVAELQVEVGPG